MGRRRERERERERKGGAILYFGFLVNTRRA